VARTAPTRACGAGDRVEIVDYDPAWPSVFGAVASEISEALGPWLVAIEHIGSTAVPQLAAKPVIDVMVGVRSLAADQDIVAAVEAIGYEYVPAFEAVFPSRRYFRRWQGGRRTVQIHLVERADAEWWDRHIGFRDWLRSHAEDRRAYETLKRSLASTFGDDRVGYTDAKTEFVRAIERRIAPPAPSGVPT
jgi:GrpB-like predicted nucleotidyltransferase (UPF0157 family)